MKHYFSIFSFLFLFSALLAQAEPQSGQTGGLDNLKLAAGSLCTQAKELLPIIVFVMIIMSAIVYAAGQIFGAELRSRANVWATAMIIGSIIAVILVLVVPQFLYTLYGDPNANFGC